MQPTQTQQQLQRKQPPAGQLDGSQYAQFPQQMGQGFPEPVQSFPTDMASLQQIMTAGYSPGASAPEFAQAQNAHALARAQERVARQQAMEADEEVGDQQALAEIMQRVMSRRGATGGAGLASPGAAPSPQPY